MTVHLSKLLDGDAAESNILLNACRSDGFFYLNIDNIDDDVFPVVDSMFQLDRELYDLPDEEKMAYDVDKLSELKLNGYVNSLIMILRL
jgi:isopenicillin N synthase-like dioxygenase